MSAANIRLPLGLRKRKAPLIDEGELSAEQTEGMRVSGFIPSGFAALTHLPLKNKGRLFYGPSKAPSRRFPFLSF